MSGHGQGWVSRNSGFFPTLLFSLLFFTPGAQAASQLEFETPAHKSIRLRVTVEPDYSWLDAARWGMDPRWSAVQTCLLAISGHYQLPLKITQIQVVPPEQKVAENPQPKQEKETETIGLDGFCPVTLKRQQRWVSGSEEFVSKFQGQTFRFVGETEKHQFEEEPEAYAPVAEGLDLVLLKEKKIAKRGHRRHGVFYRDHVYLFSCEGTLQKFGVDPQSYLSKESNLSVAPEVNEESPNISPEEAKPDAVNGYCIISYFERQKWVLGRETIFSVYRGKRYRFAGEREKEIFDWNPNIFLPAADGNDVVLWVDTKEIVPGDRRQAVWYRDRLYFFSTDRSREKFEGYPDAYYRAKTISEQPFQVKPDADSTDSNLPKKTEYFKGLEFDLEESSEPSKK